MHHDAALAARTQAHRRPASAVGHGVGLAGLAGIAAWSAAALLAGLSGPLAALLAVPACGLPMVMWSLLADRVHRRPSTGIDWSVRAPLRGTLGASLVKLAAFWTIWAGIAALYCSVRFYAEGDFAFAMWVLVRVFPLVAAASVPYVLWIDGHLIEVRDGAWSFGAMLARRPGADPRAAMDFLRGWIVKAFFLAFVLSAMPPVFGTFVRAAGPAAARDPAALARCLIAFMYLVDLAFGCVGYAMAMRPLDSHIRSTNPHASAWMAALVCYPPFVLTSRGGPLDYHVGTRSWDFWLQDHPLAIVLVAASLVVLTAVYAWSTVAFGLRFSNLTNRGILTHGPYAISRHPAYLAKNLIWWVSFMPVLTVGAASDAVRSVVLLSAIGAIYLVRARTEELHLSQDPAYRAYASWMRRHGPLRRIGCALVRRPAAVTA